MSKKAFRVFLTSLFAIAFALGALTTANSTQAHAATVKTSTQQSTPNSKLSSEPSWIIKAGPYVHVANGIAAIDPAIKKVLSSSDVALVTQAVQKYNALPLATKTKVATTGIASAHASIVPYASCPSNSGRIYGPYYYWWGKAVTLNHCLVQLLWWAVYIGGSTAAAIAIWCGFATAGVCALLAGLAAVYITATIAALNAADGQCDNRGANLNFTNGVAIPWVNAVC